MEEIAALIPGAAYRSIANSGHMIPVEQPGHLDAILRAFLSTHFPASVATAR
jgi:pimeloyl-ACP methyl ester carboxylesterase